MRNIKFDIAAGEAKQFNLTGKYFYLSKAAAAVGVQLWQGGQPVDDNAVDVVAGFKTRPLKGFDVVIITSATAQNVEFFYTAGEGGYDRFNISGMVDVSGSAVTVTNTVKTIQQGMTYGGSYRSTALLAANTPDTIFTPAANINGAVIHSMQALIQSASGLLNSAYLAKSSAPASVTDGDGILSADFGAYAASNFYQIAMGLKQPLFIPAGKGLYFISNLAESNVSRSVLYTLL